MKTSNNRSIFLGLALILLIVATFMIVSLNYLFDTKVIPSSSVKNLNINGFFLSKSLPLASVKFVSTDESLVSTDAFKNHWTLLALGYTQCPDICPMTLLKLDNVLSNIPIDERPKIAFLSIDIAPENIEKLNDYMEYFNKDFIGLSTTKAQLGDFFSSLGASYSIKKSESGSLDIEHSSSIFLISPDKNYVANFPYMLTAEQISQDYLAITR
ncbi:hypothetical protein CJF42_15825 [Pseudoalteromonas sp. NBT06-2]|uniref:SCO family protein n=1 Tax=Pseudoalteromonas sp. NBT06-2 TaxID=2025950 RepID=UPI000BA4F286|nr:SCO family protein [Pseudoalteromonas sp. NBT06-2]PAJ73450.1 hypothetical protein CJF42_15825 [Pseudoalteromonas sp. NBT06-2]